MGGPGPGSAGSVVLRCLPAAPTGCCWACSTRCQPAHLCVSLPSPARLSPQCTLLPACPPHHLQDAALRKKVDERRQDAELRREFAAVAAREERERQWRIAKGQATAADLAGPVAPQPVGVQRETWMTELPPEKRQPTAAVMPTVGGRGRHGSRLLMRCCCAGAQDDGCILLHALTAGAVQAGSTPHLPCLCPQERTSKRPTPTPALPRRRPSRAFQPRACKAGETPAAGQ